MSALAPGFADPVFDGQRAFRVAMDVLARPGLVRRLVDGAPTAAPLPPAAAALALALCDYETSIHLSPALRAGGAVADYLRFHTGAPIVEEGSKPAFAIVDLRTDDLDPAAFAQGTPDYPDRSTTILALVDSLEDGPALALAGPGIQAVAHLHVRPLPADFIARWSRNRASFPLGVDILFATGEAVAGLPRSTRILPEVR